MEEITGVVALPDDALADALRRLPLQSLAVARCVCKAWRDIVDARALLIPHLLPRSVHGVFINYIDLSRPRLFARPSSSTPSTIDGLLTTFMPSEEVLVRSVLDHCNGLLLCNIRNERSSLCVCNPATRQWTLLPAWCQEARHFNFDDHQHPRRFAGAYLAFDPAVSPHYQVFLIPSVPEKPTPPDPFGAGEMKRRALQWRQELAKPFCLDWFFASPEATLLAAEETAGDQEPFSVEEEDDDDHDDKKNDPTRFMEWPPASWTLSVFSSKTGPWEERDFVREGDPAGTVGHMRMDNPELTWWNGPRRRYSVYWQGALYVHCRGAFVARIPLSSTNKYQIITVPANIRGQKPYMGRSKEGVYFGILHKGRLSIWILNESRGQMEWVLKYQHDLRKQARFIESLRKEGEMLDGPWRVEEDNTGVHDRDENAKSDTDDDDCPPVEAGSGDEESENFESGSDDDFGNTDDETVDFVWNPDNNGFPSDEDECPGYTFDILGFHPYEEVVFLVKSFGAAAYHLDSSKIEYLGKAEPKSEPEGIHESFMYTPCIIGEPSFRGFISKESA